MSQQQRRAALSSCSTMCRTWTPLHWSPSSRPAAWPTRPSQTSPLLAPSCGCAAPLALWNARSRIIPFVCVKVGRLRFLPTLACVTRKNELDALICILAGHRPMSDQHGMLACAARMGSACSLQCPFLMVLQVLFQGVAGAGVHKLVLSSRRCIASHVCAMHRRCASCLCGGGGRVMRRCATAPAAAPAAPPS